MVPVCAWAQTTGRVDGGPWRPELSLDPNALPHVEGTLVPGAGNFNLQLVGEYARNPVVFTVPTGTVRYARDQVWLTLGAQIGIGTRMALGLQLPLLVYQASETTGTSLSPADTAAIGDPRILFRWSTRREVTSESGAARTSGSEQSQNQRMQREGIGFALNIGATLPLGSATSLASWGAPTVHASGVMDFRLFRIVGALSLGYRLRLDSHWPSQSATCTDSTSSACFFDVPQRDQITWGFSVRQPLEGLLALVFLGVAPSLASASILAGNWVTTYLTFQGAIDARAPFASAATTPVEMGAGIQSSAFGEVTLSVGASWGLTAAPGSAAVRALAMLQWAPRFIDEDHDGLRDDPDVDQCIGLSEDFDGFEDHDGCPEDNDHDAIPDEEDSCPTVDEDEDGHEDEDGCPDADNDADGILDADDRCPDEAQGTSPDAQRRGCPDNDLDDDGVTNDEDVCPSEAQGNTVDTERRGCPMPDRDHDGVSDATDRCPDVSAGEGATAAYMGCPALPDADHDGVLDADDRCPSESETLNGTLDADGCPERPGAPLAAAVVRVRVMRASADDPGTIVLVQAVRFGPDDKVLAISVPVLNQLAVALRATARWPSRTWAVTVPVTAPAVRGPMAVNAARAVRRRDDVIRILRSLGVDDRILVATEPAPPLAPTVLGITGDRGIVLQVRQ
jgi:OmpA-OmpF porin, OOP family